MAAFKLVRRVFNAETNSIVGHLYLDGVFYCTTIENWKRCVPSGSYSLVFTYSPKFKRKLPLLVVPRRSGIRIHSGNTSKDSQGCILVGNRDGYFSIKNSRDVLTRILSLFASRNVPKTIVIV